MNTTGEYNVDEIARCIFIFIGSLEVVSGVAGNCLLLTVLFTRLRSMGLKSFHHYFIANLAVTDLVTLGYWLPFFVLDLIMGKNLAENDAHCKVNGFIIAVCLATGVLSLTCISLNRYLHVCHNHLYHRVFTRAHTIACCVCLWVFSSLLAVPPLVNVGAYGYSNTSHICSWVREGRGQPGPNINDGYPRAMVVIFAMIPMCVVGYLNYGIFRYWKMGRLKLSKKYPSFGRDQERLEDLPQMMADNVRIEMDTFDSKIQSEPNATKIVDIDQSETSISESQDETDESEDEETSAYDSRGPGQQQDTQPLDVQPVQPLVNRHAGNDLHEEILQPQAVNNDLRKEVVNSDENNDDTQISILEDNPGQQQSQQCLSSQKCEPTQDTKQGQKEEVDMICSRGRHQPQLASAQAHVVHLQPMLARGPSLTERKRLSRRRRKGAAREMAFVRSLCVVFFLMLLSISSFGIATVVDSFTPLQPNALMACILVLFFNSSVNWIVYGVMNRSFKRGYTKLVRRVVRTCCRRPGAEWVNHHKRIIRTRSMRNHSDTAPTWQERSTDV